MGGRPFGGVIFEELPVWQEAIRLVDKVYDMTESKDWHGSRSLRDQLERAALSVSNNIAEGLSGAQQTSFLHFYTLHAAPPEKSVPCYVSLNAEKASPISNLKFQI